MWRKCLLHRHFKELEEIGCISLQSSMSSFCKIQIFEFAYSALPLFYSSFRLSHREIWLLWYLICSFQYMFIHFVSFRFAKYSKPSIANKWLPVRSRLSPHVDEAECLRVGGRLPKVPVPEETQHPLILDPKHEITCTIVMHNHLRLYCTSNKHILNETEVLDPKRAGHDSKDLVKLSVVL